MANNHKMYKILDTDNVQDISSNFIGYIFEGKKVDNEIFLDTCDGILIYNTEDVEELDINMNTIKAIRRNRNGLKAFMQWLMSYNDDMDFWDTFKEFVECEG